MTRQGLKSLPARIFKSKKKKVLLYYFRYSSFVKTRPLTAFLVVLGLLLGLVIVGNVIAKPPASPVLSTQIKNVRVYSIGKAPTITVQAQIQKDGVINIIAQTQGIVQNVAVKEGDNVQRGANLVSLSTNYQGGNAAVLSKQLAQVQFQNVSDTYDKQKDIIQKQRDLANANSDNTQKLREISHDNLNDINSLINLNQDIVNTLNVNLKNLEDTNIAGANDALILATKEQISSFQSAVTQLNAQSRGLDFSTNTDNPPTKIADTTKDMVSKQLDIAEKALELSKKVAQIQLSLAEVNAALMFPSSPAAGVVQKVNVHVGQSVTPGTSLMTIYSPKGSVTAVAKVPRTVAQTVSKLENSILLIGDEVVNEMPDFVSTQATDGQLYSIIYQIPANLEEKVTDLGFINVEIPLGQSDTNSVVPFIPLDSIFQTQEQAFVYVVQGDKADSKKVELGQVLGGDVEIKSGLSEGDQIILNRNIVAGDHIKIEI